jgi:predicted ribosome quality control (RQC) complex YloA/Tae2 family protein
MANEIKPQKAEAAAKPSQIDTAVNKALTDLLLEVKDVVASFRNSNFSRHDTVPDKRFDIYSKAFQGFAQNNVSKKEGFALEVKVDPSYNDRLQKLIEERKKQEQNIGLTSTFG